MSRHRVDCSCESLAPNSSCRSLLDDPAGRGAQRASLGPNLLSPVENRRIGRSPDRVDKGYRSIDESTECASLAPELLKTARRDFAAVWVSLGDSSRVARAEPRVFVPMESKITCQLASLSVPPSLQTLSFLVARISGSNESMTT